MPYFPKKHILFIHIPKTGGSTVENCLKENDNIQLFDIYNFNHEFLNKPMKHISLQHQTYNTIYTHQNDFNIDFNDSLRIISVVRNPYDRIISDLFFYKLINNNTPPHQVFDIINTYLKEPATKYDNHSIPQYKFVTNNDKQLIENITIFKTETLND